ncbi:MAG TPA: hypothetical protein VJ252_01155, partial [Chthoniobacterales bacterium]|nr:hypothetical protein [Chthoniobacterales bacterium]
MKYDGDRRPVATACVSAVIPNPGDEEWLLDPVRSFEACQHQRSSRKNAASNMPNRRKLAAYALPMLLFVALLALNSLLKKIDHRFWLSSAEYWIYPLQTILCGGLVFWFRR